MSAIIDVANEVFTAADNAAWDPATITVEGWMKHRTDPAAYAYLVSHGASWTLVTADAPDTRKGQANWFGDGAESIIGTTVNAVDTWFHMAFVADGSTLKIYVNGVLEGTNATAPGVTANGAYELEVGSSDADAAVRDIKVSDIRIWSTARTAGEILANYNVRLTGSETGLVGYWKFDEGTGNTAQDSTSNNRDLTAVAGNWDGADDPTFVTASSTGAGFIFMSI